MARCGRSKSPFPLCFMQTEQVARKTRQQQSGSQPALHMTVRALPKHCCQETGMLLLSRRSKSPFHGRTSGQPPPMPTRTWSSPPSGKSIRARKARSRPFCRSSCRGRSANPASRNSRSIRTSQSRGNSFSTKYSPAKRRSPTTSRPTTSRTSSSARRFPSSPSASGRSSGSSNSNRLRRARALSF
jgi:hypothetical protein